MTDKLTIYGLVAVMGLIFNIVECFNFCYSYFTLHTHSRPKITLISLLEKQINKLLLNYFKFLSNSKVSLKQAQIISR